MRRLWPYLVVLAAALVYAWALPNVGFGDAAYFFVYGNELLSHHWIDAFQDKVAQVGPLQLALFGAIWRVARAAGWDPFTLESYVVQALTALGIAAAAGYLTRGHRRQTLVILAAGLLSLVTATTTEAALSAHPADALLPTAWIVAGVAARRGNPWVGAILIGLGAGFELWSLLGLPLLLLAPRWRDILRPAVVAVALPALMLLPFALGGRFHMFEIKWYVKPNAPIALLVHAGTAYTWPFRVLQGGAAVLAGVAMLRVRRLELHLPVLTALTIFCVRLLLDPYQHVYYFTGITACAIMGALLFATSPLAAHAWAERRTQSEPAPPAPL